MWTQKTLSRFTQTSQRHKGFDSGLAGVRPDVKKPSEVPKAAGPDPPRLSPSSSGVQTPPSPKPLQNQKCKSRSKSKPTCLCQS